MKRITILADDVSLQILAPDICEKAASPSWRSLSTAVDSIGTPLQPAVETDVGDATPQSSPELRADIGAIVTGVTVSDGWVSAELDMVALSLPARVRMPRLTTLQTWPARPNPSLSK
jgi:hypothetical protein